MGKVGITVKVLPKDVDVDFEKIKKDILSLKEKLGAEDIKISEVPIAFGLKAIIVGIVREESLGTEGIEEEISKIDGVGEVRIESATLL